MIFYIMSLRSWILKDLDYCISASTAKRGNTYPFLLQRKTWKHYCSKNKKMKIWNQCNIKGRLIIFMIVHDFGEGRGKGYSFIISECLQGWYWWKFDLWECFVTNVFRAVTTAFSPQFVWIWVVLQSHLFTLQIQTLILEAIYFVPLKSAVVICSSGTYK